MFDRQIDHARNMIERLQRCKDEAHERLPIGVGVPDAELSTWYTGVYEAIVEQFGKDSVQFERFKDANQNANDFKNDWIRNHWGESTEPAYIGYLQTVVAFLVSLQNDEPVTKISMATGERGAVNTDGKAALPERIIQKLKQHAIVAFLILVATITIAVGDFFGALSKIREFFSKQTDVRPTTVAELQNVVRATSIELKQAFDSVTVGRTPPIPEGDFRRVLDLIAKIERLDRDNGHVTYYRAFITRWRNQRPASHDALFWYLERAKDPTLYLPGDNGDANFCFDNWHGFCKQRQGFINHMLAVDFQQAANEAKDPAVALTWLKAALERAKAAITVYGEFTDPGQGLPTKVLAERLERQISDMENALKETDPKQ